MSAGVRAASGAVGARRGDGVDAADRGAPPPARGVLGVDRGISGARGGLRKASVRARLAEGDAGQRVWALRRDQYVQGRGRAWSGLPHNVSRLSHVQSGKIETGILAQKFTSPVYSN